MPSYALSPKGNKKIIIRQKNIFSNLIKLIYFIILLYAWLYTTHEIIDETKKDIIINLGGDNIAPSKIENILCLNESIKQSFVYGDKKNYLVALLVVEKDTIKEKIKII